MGLAAFKLLCMLVAWHWLLINTQMCNRLKMYRMECWLKEVQALLGLYEVYIGANSAFVLLKAHGHFIKATFLGQTPELVAMWLPDATVSPPCTCCALPLSSHTFVQTSCIARMHRHTAAARKLP